MQASRVLEIFNRLGIIIRNDHFIYTSDRDGAEMHGDTYINKDGLYPYPHETFKLCRELAKRSLCHVGDDMNCVVGPEKGGIILSQLVGYFLMELMNTGMRKQTVISLFAEKIKNTTGKTGFIFNRGYGDLVADKDVLIVEDVINTGESVRKVADLVRQYGGRVWAVGSLCNRGSASAQDIGIPRMFSLLDICMESWSADICPLCIEGFPVNRQFGKGKEFVAG